MSQRVVGRDEVRIVPGTVMTSHSLAHTLGPLPDES
jgi:hypothetical protein